MTLPIQVLSPLDGRYRGAAAVRELWKKFAAANDNQPRRVVKTQPGAR